MLALAESELGITADVDLGPFRASADGLFGATSVTGTVTYAPGVTAALTVVKLGLSAASPARLRERPTVDRPFPHHSTFWYPWFERARIEAYRDLGDHSTTAAVTAAPAGGPSAG